ncbi:hypothetical protein DAT36_04355 [Photobacterium phosphoreum]|nr:hypothetical protein DAT36_04355 [Photobacterium phosphoreum]
MFGSDVLSLTLNSVEGTTLLGLLLKEHNLSAINRLIEHKKKMDNKIETIIFNIKTVLFECNN